MRWALLLLVLCGCSGTNECKEPGKVTECQLTDWIIINVNDHVWSRMREECRCVDP